VIGTFASELLDAYLQTHSGCEAISVKNPMISKDIMTRFSPVKISCASIAISVVLASTSIGRAEPVTLVPHRAAYELTLLNTRGKSVSSASGRIALEFTGNPCEGYATTFRQVTQISDEEGKGQTSDMRLTTFEAGDGKALRFNGEKRTNEGRPELTVGNAERANDGGLSIDVKQPKPTKIDVDGIAVFPTEHIIRLITAAKKGDRVLEIKLYDGSDGGEKIYDTTAIIGSPVPTTGRSVEEPSEKAGLKPMTRWPIAISYFEPGTGERTPVYVLSFDLFENGVSGALKLDFGDFSLKGELKRLELLKAVECVK
jgi:EipB-like